MLEKAKHEENLVKNDVPMSNLHPYKPDFCFVTKFRYPDEKSYKRDNFATSKQPLSIKKKGFR